METISKELVNQIEEELTRIGFMFRIYQRIKSKQSIQKKVTEKQYDQSGKKVQDYIGIRINLYFTDDITPVIKLLENIFDFNNKEVDERKVDIFKPQRTNIVFNLSARHKAIFDDILRNHSHIIDSTFEVQIRSVLSEGWHEVEHDLRYKCQDEWENNKDLSRTLNGIYATLETGEWAIIKVFDELSYRKYKAERWESMLQSKFRLRFSPDHLSDNLKSFLDSHPDEAKLFFRINRDGFLSNMIKTKINWPKNYNNLIYILNYLYVRNDQIYTDTPQFLQIELNEAFPA